jgi:hypothetical protein
MLPQRLDICPAQHRGGRQHRRQDVGGQAPGQLLAPWQRTSGQLGGEVGRQLRRMRLMKPPRIPVQHASG